jgi:hypothetical protein
MLAIIRAQKFSKFVHGSPREKRCEAKDEVARKEARADGDEADENFRPIPLVI